MHSFNIRPMKPATRLSRFLLPAIVCGLAALTTTASAVLAQPSEPVRFVEAGLVSDFPESIKFHASIDTDLEVEDIRVRFGVGHGDKNRYNYLDLDRGGGSLVEGELDWMFNTTGRYIPPGSIVRFHFEVLDTDGNEHLSEDYETIMHDARYEWEEVDSGSIRVYYHGPVETRATRLAEAGSRLLDLMQPITGGETDTPISVTLYNNNAEMIGAVQGRSATTSRELITEGQAFHDESIVLVLAGTRDIGTLTHELTHILVGRAAGGTSALVPLWLNEGLAEYGNLDQGLSYQYYLEWAVDTGRLKPFSSLSSFPGDPSLNLVAYGQSRSFVTYLIEEYGGAKVAEVLASIREGNNGDSAIRSVYGETLLSLENEWRYKMGADEYVPPRSFAAPATATPEPTPVPVVQPTATPTPMPEPVPIEDTPTVEVEEPAEIIEPTATPEPTVAQAEAEPTSVPEETSSGTCGAPPKDGRMDASAFVLAIMLASLAVYQTVLRKRSR